MNAIGFLAVIAVFIIGFFIGKETQKTKDKPAYIRENTKHDGSKHHYHDHDLNDIIKTGRK